MPTKQSNAAQMRVRRETAGILDRMLSPGDVANADVPERMPSRFSRQRNGHDPNAMEDLYYAAVVNPAGLDLAIAYLIGVKAELAGDGASLTLREAKRREQETDGAEDVAEVMGDDPASVRLWRERLEAHLPNVVTAIAVSRRYEQSPDPRRMPRRSYPRTRQEISA